MKKLILILILIGLIISGFALAQDAELEYPEVGGEEIGEGLGGYVTYIYTFSIMIAGIIVFAVLIYAGFRYLTSAGNPAAIKRAKRQAFGAFLGLILLLTSYLILNTINPDLLKFSWKELREKPEFKPNRGICFYNQEQERLCFVKSSKSFPKDFEASSVEFMSTKDELFSIHTFSQKGWKGAEKIYLNRKGKMGFENEYKRNIYFSPKSFFLYWSNPGVYLFKKGNMQLSFPNEPLKLYRTSIADLESYDNQVKSMRLQPKCSEENGKKVPVLGPYGAILHSEVNFEGTSTIIFRERGDVCEYYPVRDLSSRIIGHGASSLTVFEHSYEGNKKGSVTFYDRAFYQGDRFKVSAGAINEYWHVDLVYYPFEGTIKGFTTTLSPFPAASVEEGDGALDDGKLDRIQSLKIEGNYLVVLSSTLGKKPGKKEQMKEFSNPSEVIFKSDPNLNTNYVLGGRETEKELLLLEGGGYLKIHSISIIPIQEPIAKP